LGAVLLGAPFSLRKKRVLAVLLMALTISAAGFLMSCGGSRSSSSTTPAPRIYTVTVTPQGSGTVTNPSPVSVTLTVQ
jgi:multidrug resistance efflux pump